MLCYLILHVTYPYIIYDTLYGILYHLSLSIYIYRERERCIYSYHYHYYWYIAPAPGSRRGSRELCARKTWALLPCFRCTCLLEAQQTTVIRAKFTHRILTRPSAEKGSRSGIGSLRPRCFDGDWFDHSMIKPAGAGHQGVRPEQIP